MSSSKWSYGSYGQNKMAGKGYWGDKKYDQGSCLASIPPYASDFWGWVITRGCGMEQQIHLCSLGGTVHVMAKRS